MRKALTILLLTTMLSVSTASAADLPGSTSISTGTTNTQSTLPVSTDTNPSVTTDLNAAPNPTAATVSVAPSVGSSLGEYKSVACNSNPAFGTNACNECFVWGSVKVGWDIDGLFDNWTNTTNNMLIAYKDEQKLPTMVSFGSTWTNTPTDLAKFWKNSSDITWISTESGGRMNYILQPGQKVKFIESEIGARYTLNKTDKKNGEMVWMMKFPVVSHAADKVTATTAAATTHYECVSYTLEAPVVTPSKPVPPVTPPTKVETGPQTLVLILAAFFIAFGMMFSLRKRS